MNPLRFIFIVSTFKMGRGSSEVTEHLSGMGKVLSLIPRTTFKCEMTTQASIQIYNP